MEFLLTIGDVCARGAAHYSQSSSIHVHGDNRINLLKPTGHVMHQQFNIQQVYVLPTLYLCVLYLSENKQRLVPLTIFITEMKSVYCAVRTGPLNKAVCASYLKGKYRAGWAPDSARTFLKKEK